MEINATLLLLSLGALILGTLMGILLTKPQRKVLQSRMNEKLEENAQLQGLLSKKEQELRQQERDNTDMKISLENLRTTNLNLKQSLSEESERHKEEIRKSQERFSQSLEQLKLQITATTEDILKKRQQELSQENLQSLGNIVAPLKESISNMRKTMEDSNNLQSTLSGELKANMENMIRQNEATRLSTEELSKAFRHQSKMQGDWGETVLEELLQSQGFTKGIHFDTQYTMRNESGKVISSEEGKKLRPDLVLHLDQKRDVIVDSKVSISAFIDYVNASTEEERQACLKAHIESLQKHVKELSQKDYSAYIAPGKEKMDYVIMFVPHSGALWTALNAKPDLWRNAMEMHVFIADEQTLYAALRIINLTWRQISQAQNHEKVYALANEMIERVGQFISSYNEIGNQLQRTRDSYEKGLKKLCDGGQSIPKTCQKLLNLGAKQSSKNPIPETFLQDGMDSQE